MKNKFNLSNTLYIVILITSDLFFLLISLKIAFYLRSNYLADFFPFLDSSTFPRYYWVVFLSFVIFLFEKIYFVRYDFWSDTKKVLKGLLLSFVIVFTVITLTKISHDYSRAFITLFFITASFIIPFSKRYLKKVLFKFNFFREKVRVVGKSYLVDRMKKELEENWYLGYKLSKKRFNVVILISKNFTTEQSKRLIRIYSKKTKNIYVVPYMYHIDFTHANIVDYFNIRLSAISIENKLLDYGNLFIKYFSEKLLVLSILPFSLFVHLIILFLIKNDSKGKIFFKQKRMGIKGQEFSCYKYRTMYEDGDKLLEKYLENNPEEVEYYSIYHKYKNDPRITKVGRFLRATSLDEFPQFFNVLRGDMNLIGPRPYMINEKEKIGKYNKNIILEVKPGITGLWQVSGRNNLTFEERIELDKWYIQNWSLWIDFVIFMKTIKVVLGKIGAR
ncbi:sugar transferase [Halarcobacter sp.]|uniref:sugar transferase n=1 Tax=Halarcobacter sp. TaxID=2321133 RepID=UPI0029F4ABA4|nr:sugar transferase [Halarcobacter sp.]